MSEPSEKPSAVGVHVYAGGFSLGVAQHYEVRAQFEELALGFKTFEANWPAGVRHPHRRDLWDHLLPDYQGVDLVYGNPPCAPWSMASRGPGVLAVAKGVTGTDDPRLAYTATTMEVGLRLQPQAFVLETVARGWTHPEGREVYETYADRWRAEGYAVTMLLTNALLHGLGSSRERAHFIAHRHELPLHDPIAFRPRTVRETIGDLEDVLGGVVPNHEPKPFVGTYLNVAERLRQGEPWKFGVEAGLRDGVPVVKASVSSRRLWYDVPSLTVVSAGLLVHPTQHRYITLREMARLVGYPDDYVFHDRTYKGTEIGRTVSPVMGKYLAGLTAAALDINRPAEPTLREVDWRAKARPVTPGVQAKALGIALPTKTEGDKAREREAKLDQG